MISGKDKPFVKGGAFKFSTSTKYKPKGKYCQSCTRWKANSEYEQYGKICAYCRRNND